MAVDALRPAVLPANTDRYVFSLALAHLAEATAVARLLPASSSILDEIGAGDRLDRACAGLAEAPAPDHAALALKLRLTLAPAGVPLALIQSLAGDVHRLGFMREARG